MKIIKYNTYSFDPELLLLGIVYKNNLTKISLDMCTKTFIARLATIKIMETIL
jgi:hypothetical protein